MKLNELPDGPLDLHLNGHVSVPESAPLQSTALCRHRYTWSHGEAGSTWQRRQPTSEDLNSSVPRGCYV
jgi:hypothetical protein